MNDWLGSALMFGTAGPRRDRFVPTVGDNWATDACHAGEQCLVGDLDGDGKDDTLAISASGWRAGFSYGMHTFSGDTARLQPGAGFEVHAYATTLTATGSRYAIARVDGDSRRDVLAFTGTGVYVARSLPSRGGFATPVRIAPAGTCVPGSMLCLTGNVLGVAGEGLDVLEIDTVHNTMRLLFMTGPDALVPNGIPVGASTVCPVGARCQLADVTGDGHDDLVIITSSGDVQVAVNTRNVNTGVFAPPVRWVAQACTSNVTCQLADVDGDRQADLVVFDQTSRSVSVIRNYGTPAHLELGWHGAMCGLGQICMTGDVDGDGLADVIGFTHGQDPARAGGVDIATSTASIDR